MLKKGRIVNSLGVHEMYQPNANKTRLISMLTNNWDYVILNQNKCGYRKCQLKCPGKYFMHIIITTFLAGA